MRTTILLLTGLQTLTLLLLMTRTIELTNNNDDVIVASNRVIRVGSALVGSLIDRDGATSLGCVVGDLLMSTDSANSKKKELEDGRKLAELYFGANNTNADKDDNKAIVNGRNSLKLSDSNSTLNTETEETRSDAVYKPVAEAIRSLERLSRVTELAVYELEHMSRTKKLEPVVEHLTQMITKMKHKTRFAKRAKQKPVELLNVYKAVGDEYVV